MEYVVTTKIGDCNISVTEDKGILSLTLTDGKICEVITGNTRVLRYLENTSWNESMKNLYRIVSEYFYTHCCIAA